MEYFCFVALLFSAVAAQPEQPRQWQRGNNQFIQFGRPQQNPNRRPVKPNSRDPFIQDGSLPPFGAQPSGGELNFRPIGGGPMLPGWYMGGTGNTAWPTQDQMPPWYINRPSGGPGNGDTQGPMGGPYRGTPQSGIPTWTSRSGGTAYPEGDEMGPDFGYFHNSPVPYPAQGPPPRSNSRQRKPAGAPRQRPNMQNPETWPNRNTLQPSSGGGGPPSFDYILFGGRPLKPEIVDNREFIPIFQADNVTIQNVSGLPLKEGENIFLLPKAGRGPPPRKNGRNGPEELGFGYPNYSGFQPYLKLIYNPSATPKYSFQYGITTLLPSFMKVEGSESWEEKEQ